MSDQNSPLNSVLNINKISEIKDSKSIIAFDLDGTLSESKQPITEEMSVLICKLATKRKVAIISGGSFSQFRIQLIPGLTSCNVFDLENSGPVDSNSETAENSLQTKAQAIFSNIILMPTSGSVRYEYSKNENEWIRNRSYPFPDEIKQKVLSKLNEILADKNKREEFGILDEHFGEYVEDRETQITFSGLGQDAPNDKKTLWDRDSAKRNKLKQELESEIPEIEGRIGGMTSLDILPKGFDKAVGLKALLEDKGLTIKNMLFIGDAVFPGGNDYSPVEAGVDTIGISGPIETKKAIELLLEA